MHSQTKKITITFAHPFQLEGFDAPLPAGVYYVESEDDVLDDMFLPDNMRTSVLIHMHPTICSPGYSQSLRVPWAALEAALEHDRSPIKAQVLTCFKESALSLLRPPLLSSGKSGTTGG